MAMSQTRYDELKAILEDRRKSVQAEIDARLTKSRPSNKDEEACIVYDINFAIIQMKAETIRKIGECLQGLEQDSFGYCFGCRNEIDLNHLRNLPFVVRCKSCEEAREEAERRERVRPRGFHSDF